MAADHFQGDGHGKAALADGAAAVAVDAHPDVAGTAHDVGHALGGADGGLAPPVVGEQAAAGVQEGGVEQRQAVLPVQLVEHCDGIIPEHLDTGRLELANPGLQIARPPGLREDGFDVEQPAVEAVRLLDAGQLGGKQVFALAALLEQPAGLGRRLGMLQHKGAQHLDAGTVAGVDPGGRRDGDALVRKVDEGGGELEVFGRVDGALGSFGQRQVALCGFGLVIRAQKVVAENKVCDLVAGGWRRRGAGGQGCVGDVDCSS